MNYILLILAGVIMGLIAAVPIGPVNLICIRRSFAFGPLNGFVSGLGAATGDGVFAAITFFGLTWHRNRDSRVTNTIFEVVGGALLVWFGVHTILAPVIGKVEEGDKNDKGASTLVAGHGVHFRAHHHQSGHLDRLRLHVCQLSHALVERRHISLVDAGFVVAGVVAGSAGWWLSLTTLIGLFHTRVTDGAVRAINRGSGALVAVFGVVVLLHIVSPAVQPRSLTLKEFGGVSVAPGTGPVQAGG